jgi:DNA invertase Pin-like site-specific DNA recombinase
MGCTGQSPTRYRVGIHGYGSSLRTSLFTRFAAGLNRLMADAHRRRFAVLLVWKVERFGRSLRHLVNALADLDAAGVVFVYVLDNLDLSTPSGRLMFQVVGAMAEFERALTQERVRAGLRLARMKVKKLWRPRSGVNPEPVSTLRVAGASWPVVSGGLGIGVGRAVRALQSCSKKSHWKMDGV